MVKSQRDLKELKAYVSPAMHKRLMRECVEWDIDISAIIRSAAQAFVARDKRMVSIIEDYEPLKALE